VLTHLATGNSGVQGCASILSPEWIFDLSETSNFDPSLSEEGPTKISTAYPTSSVAISDYAGWSLYGAPWLQPVANSGKSTEHGNGGNTPKPLPWVATGCLRRSMVRRGVDGSSPSEGSAKACTSGCVHVDLQVQPHAVAMEPFMEPSSFGARFLAAGFVAVDPA